MSEEFELKLRMSPERLEQLRRSALLRSLARERAVTRHLTSVYFDTPDRALQQRGIALRIRQIGDRRIQTVKVPLGEAGAVHAHRELETDVDSDTPQLHQIADDELREFLTRPEIASSLQPVFSSDFERTAVPVKLFDSEIEVALDHGEIGAGGRSAPLSEAELELKTGRRERLYELAIALNESIPVSLGGGNQGRPRLSAGGGRGAGLLRAGPVELTADMTARAAFAAIAKSALEQLRLNEACALIGEDIEGVHQQRVAIRRLRSLISAFKDTMTGDTRGYLVHELKWLQGVLGPARDWDVFIHETLAQMRQRLPEEATLLESFGGVASAAAKSAYDAAAPCH